MVIKLIRNAFLRNRIEKLHNGGYKIDFHIPLVKRHHSVYGRTPKELLNKVDAIYDKHELELKKKRAQGTNL